MDKNNSEAGGPGKSMRNVYGLRAGLSGTALLFACWIAAPWISSLSFYLWAGLMCMSAIMCFYGAIFRSWWFLCPGVVAILSVIGTFLGGLINSEPA